MWQMKGNENRQDRLLRTINSRVFFFFFFFLLLPLFGKSSRKSSKEINSISILCFPREKKIRFYQALRGRVRKVRRKDKSIRGTWSRRNQMNMYKTKDIQEHEKWITKEGKTERGKRGKRELTKRRNDAWKEGYACFAYINHHGFHTFSSSESCLESIINKQIHGKKHRAIHCSRDTRTSCQLNRDTVSCSCKQVKLFCILSFSWQQQRTGLRHPLRLTHRFEFCKKCFPRPLSSTVTQDVDVGRADTDLVVVIRERNIEIVNKNYVRILCWLQETGSQGYRQYKKVYKRRKREHVSWSVLLLPKKKHHHKLCCRSSSWCPWWREKKEEKKQFVSRPWDTNVMTHRVSPFHYFSWFFHLISLWLFHRLLLQVHDSYLRRINSIFYKEHFCRPLFGSDYAKAGPQTIFFIEYNPFLEVSRTYHLYLHITHIALFTLRKG